MLSEMTAREFHGWRVAESLGYVEIESTQREMRADWRTAHIVATISNLFRKHPVPLADFVLKWFRGSEEKVVTQHYPNPQELLAKARSYYLAFSKES